MLFDPDTMTDAKRDRVLRWLDANGLRDLIAWAPITLRGNVVTYQAVCRKHKATATWYDKPGGVNLNADRELVTTTRRLRIRTPLRKVQ